MMECELAIVTVTYNSGSVLREFLESLASDIEMIPKFRLYLIDNASEDKTVKIAKEFQSEINITIIANTRNTGAAGGNNQGIANALSDGAEWILLVNNDTIIPPGTLGGLVKVAATEKIHLLSPVIAGTEPAHTVWYAGGSLFPYKGMKVRHDGMGSSLADVPRGLRPTEYASTCCLLVHADVFFAIGGLDDDYFVYFEDVDFAIRAKAAGFQMWITGDFRIVHKASSLTGGYLSPFTVRWISRNWVLAARKHCVGLQRLTAFAYMQAWMLARMLTFRDTPEIYFLRQRSFAEGLKLHLTPAAVASTFPNYKPNTQKR